MTRGLKARVGRIEQRAQVFSQPPRVLHLVLAQADGSEVRMRINPGHVRTEKPMEAGQGR